MRPNGGKQGAMTYPHAQGHKGFERRVNHARVSYGGRAKDALNTGPSLHPEGICIPKIALLKLAVLVRVDEHTYTLTYFNLLLC
eukprot:247545-Pyramimonas_sp.AAC.1